MTIAQKALCRYPAIGNNAHDRRHKDRYDALHGEKCSNMCTHADVS